MKNWMTRFIVSASLVLLTSTVVADTSNTTTPDTAAAPSPSKSAVINDRADRTLRQMSAYLSEAEAFSFRAYIEDDAVSDRGQIIQYGGSLQIFVQRPGRLFAEFDGDERHTKVMVSNNSLKIFDVRKRLYSITPTPPQIDGALDTIFEKFGVSVPISDILYSNPYEVLSENVLRGIYVGHHKTDGIAAHHLAFEQETIDWQIWIKDGPTPVPLKLIIDYKLEPGSPRYTARLSHWDFAPHISKQFFDFHPPHNASEINFLPRQQGEAEQ